MNNDSTADILKIHMYDCGKPRLSAFVPEHAMEQTIVVPNMDLDSHE
jgi:hypothetical protein